MKYITLLYFIILVAGCAISQPQCQDDGVILRTNDDYFAFKQEGKNRYIVQKRTYTKCSTNVIEQHDVTRDEFERTQ